MHEVIGAEMLPKMDDEKGAEMSLETLEVIVAEMPREVNKVP